MAKDPAVLLYTSDFLTGTLTMTNEQVGKYTRLLCLQHQKGILTEKDMINICGSYDKEVFDKFTKSGDTFYNERMKEESEKRSAYSLSRANNRLKKTDSKQVKPNNISDSYEEHMENENEIINEIIIYLNECSEKKFRSTSQKTKATIKARLNEKFTLSDFKKVIKTKCHKWKGDPKMEDYLRPETLFGTKFESYLNENGGDKENIGVGKQETNEHGYEKF